MKREIHRSTNVTSHFIRLASSDRFSSWSPLKPQHSNPKPINSGVLTSLLLPHLSSFLTDSLPSLNFLCHSKTDDRFLQDAPKTVWSIPYVSVAFFPSLKQNFIAYRSSKVSSHPDCIFEIHQLWQSGFSRVYSNSCSKCLFEPEIIKLVSHLIRCITITHWILKSLPVNAHKTEYMCFNQTGNISTVNDHIYQPLRSGRIWHKVNF